MPVTPTPHSGTPNVYESTKVCVQLSPSEKCHLNPNAIDSAEPHTGHYKLPSASEHETILAVLPSQIPME